MSENKILRIGRRNMVKDIKVETIRDSKTGQIICKSFFDADTNALIRKEDYSKKQVINSHLVTADIKQGVPDMPKMKFENGKLLPVEASAPAPRKQLIDMEAERAKGTPDMPEAKWNEDGSPDFSKL